MQGSDKKGSGLQKNEWNGIQKERVQDQSNPELTIGSDVTEKR